MAQFSFLLGILLICYSLQYYKVTYEAEAYLESTDTVFVSKENGYLLFDGPGTETAIIFYPGALVEYTAYAPILHKLSQAGIDCFLVDMPYHMSIFGTNKADKIIKQYSYNHWYMAGDSPADITPSEQWNATVEEILKVIPVTLR